MRSAYDWSRTRAPHRTEHNAKPNGTTMHPDLLAALGRERRQDLLRAAAAAHLRRSAASPRTEVCTPDDPLRRSHFSTKGRPCRPQVDTRPGASDS